MKRLIVLLLAVLMLLCGCSFSREQMKAPVTFYYLRNYGVSENKDPYFFEGAIGSEIREAAGHQEDLPYLLALYLQGPNDSQLKRPFPLGSRILSITQEDEELLIVMNSVSSRFREMDVTISCACIAKTCLGLVDVNSVTVESHGPDGRILFSRTFTDENLILEDNQELPVETSETKK